MHKFLRAARSATAPREASAAPSEVSSGPALVLSGAMLAAVGGGLNPQPLPPHVPEDF